MREVAYAPLAMPLELAKKLNKPCVQLSDDLKTISFVSSKEDKKLDQTKLTIRPISGPRAPRSSP